MKRAKYEWDGCARIEDACRMYRWSQVKCEKDTTGFYDFITGLFHLGGTTLTVGPDVPTAWPNHDLV
jgi:hypothetical protein